MPPASGFQPLPPGDEHEPTAAELAAVVDACYDEMDIVGMGENDPGVVGPGEFCSPRHRVPCDSRDEGSNCVG